MCCTCSLLHGTESEDQMCFTFIQNHGKLLSVPILSNSCFPNSRIQSISFSVLIYYPGHSDPLLKSLIKFVLFAQTDRMLLMIISKHNMVCVLSTVLFLFTGVQKLVSFDSFMLILVVPAYILFLPIPPYHPSSHCDKEWLAG